MRALRRAGITVRVASVTGAAGAARVLASLRPRVVVVDSIAFAAASALGVSPAARVIALSHMRVRGTSARSVLRRADVAVAVSPSLAREVRALGARRVRVVRPGADGVPLAPRVRSNGPLRVLCVANWSRVKGVDTLARACATLTDVRLALAGDEGTGVDARGVRAALRSVGHVRRLGSVTGARLAKLYAASDVVVVPSRDEGYGIVASEAIAHGLPVIASDLPSLRAIVGRAGALVRPGDVTALARALARARSPGVRRRWSRAATARARELPRWRDTERAVVALVVAELHAASRGGSTKTAKRIAAATTNETRRRKGETKASRRRS